MKLKGGKNWYAPMLAMPQKKKKKKNKKKKWKFKKTVKVLRKYKEYINSDDWKKRKRDYFRKYDKKCIICGLTKDIALHHLHYKTVGFENDEDLVPLCKSHHRELHSEIETNVDMKKETYDFIEENQIYLETEHFKYF